MGLAASQARLLSLTSRQHVVEGRAQFLQAQKLRLANESDRVYENYVNALDATSLQTKSYDTEGKVHWIDGSFNNLMRYDADDKVLGNVYYVQDINDSKLYMPKVITDAYNASGNNLFNFLDTIGIQYTKDAHSAEYNLALSMIDAYKNEGYDNFPYTQEQVSKYNTLRARTLNPEKNTIYSNADELYKLIKNSESTINTGVYLPSESSQYDTLLNQLKNIKSTSYYTGDTKKIIDYITTFNVSGVFDDTSKTTTVSAITAAPEKDLYVYWDKTTEEQKEDPETVQEIDDLMKLKMLLNGGTWKKIDTWEKGSYLSDINNAYNGEYTLNSDKIYFNSILLEDTDVTTKGDIYSEDIQNTLSSYLGTNMPNIGEALIKIATEIKNNEYSKTQESANNDFEAFFTSIGTTQSAFETKLANYNTYINAIAELKTLDQSTHTEYSDTNLGPYYEHMFYAIQSAGGCKEISTENAKSSSWINNMIKNAQVVLATFDEDTNEIDNVTASSNVGLREISNSTEIAKADSEYEAEMEEINSKEAKYNTQLNQLETERNAIQTEIESLKQIRDDNINSTFKLFT